ncbi:MAG: Gfo/Idh/MocA family protein [Armatimonadota bacterium]
MGITIGAYINEGGHVSGHMRDVEVHEGIDQVLVTGSEQARAIAQEMDKARSVPDWDALMREDDVRLILMLTNNRDAGRLTLEAVDSGKRVYGEKPGAHTADQMQAIVAACRRTGGHFTPCYVRRMLAESQELRRLVQGGAIGELWSVQASWITWSTALRGVDHWLFDDEMAGGGILYWLGCHWIDLLRFVTGRPIVAVSAMTATVDPRISVEDVACLAVRLEGGAIGTIRCGYLRDPSREGYEDYQLMTAYEGSHGAVSHFPHGEVTVRALVRVAPSAQGELRELRIEMPRTGGYAYPLLDEVVRATVEGRTPSVTEDDALYVLRVAEAAYQAARTGREREL